jgi:threonine dehydratase
VPELDAIVVPVGGAGLIAGIALVVKTLRPDVEVRTKMAEAVMG